MPERVHKVHHYNVQSYTEPLHREQVPHYSLEGAGYNEVYIADIKNSSDPTDPTDSMFLTPDQTLHDPIYLPLSTIPSPLLYSALPYQESTGRVIFKDSRMAPPKPVCNARGVSRNSMTDKAAALLHREVLVDKASVNVQCPDLGVNSGVLEAVVELPSTEETENMQDECNILHLTESEDEDIPLHLTDEGIPLYLTDQGEYDELYDFEEAMSEIQQGLDHLLCQPTVKGVEQGDEIMESDHNKENGLQLVSKDVNSLKCLIPAEDKRSYPSRERKTRNFFI